jgi:GNAT superfamily N-acetyltransferase
MSYIIRFYRPGDEKEIVDLLKHVFPRWNELDNALDDWMWRYHDYPIKSLVSVAEYNGHIVGANHNFNLNLKIGKNTELTTISGNSAVHPDHQGKGLYTKLSELTIKMREGKVNFNIWHSHNPIILKWAKQQGIPIFPHKISYMVRIKDVDSYLESKKRKDNLIKKIGYNTFNVLNKVKNLSEPYDLKNLDKVMIKDVRDFDESINIFWNTVKEHYNFIYERNSQYLNWRYCDKRGGNYLVKQAISDDQILGYIVLEIKQSGGYKEGYIADMLSLPDRSDIAYLLIGEAIRYFDSLGIDINHFWAVKNSVYEELARRHNFIDSRFRRYFGCLFRVDHGEYSLLKSSSPDKIHFMFGDMDRF